ncbi:hypothetical protein KC367_g7954 [Hortaea werneckii]|uniref:Mediator of RNA polymerase II transcription subunit 31 n=2 Tax=Hortaea werneckii TaxID=91943 RepID=A0A3M7J221_HORWE|nr:hypothetical protein KC350_g9588 [Hortaea werneckii]OTA32089.1 hypothetical protein BTJ68_07565 [Hortaea werneckii EXF-2000]KAI6841032.1 hypothetical protein KC342_g2520 [Hortaea werneckii]KAI6842952.1 hypothetical protein KC358_g3970 [Hortaea werneckii]KAI6941540.1 hypothetical protein KC341_g2811 [Hortaea werneckii]
MAEVQTSTQPRGDDVNVKGGRDIEWYGGASRFELELEFVQALGNPLYVHYLATQKAFEDEAFVRYLAYLQYFRLPQYLRFLQYPGPTLRMLDLLQQDQFRKDAISPALIDDLVRTGFEASTAGLAMGGGGR